MVRLKEIEKTEYDLIIANPPYNLGNKVVSQFVDKPKESIVLMPFSCYKGHNLYKNILKLNLVDPKIFNDAIITDNLCLCKLTNKEINQTFDEIELQTFDQEYRDFYELNMRLKQKITYAYSNKFYIGSTSDVYDKAKSDLKKWWKDHNKKFCLTKRTVQNGIHSVKNEKAFDILWNVTKQIDWNEKLPICIGHKRNNIGISVDFIDFTTEIECSNFAKFFYANEQNGLMNKLIKSLHKTSGSIQKAIPQIDWSVDRDYEHLTYEDLLDIMKEELKKQRGVK